jgi:hypothetical protein
MHVLVPCATKHEFTRGVAEVIVATLRRHGAEVECRRGREVRGAVGDQDLMVLKAQGTRNAVHLAVFLSGNRTWALWRPEGAEGHDAPSVRAVGQPHEAPVDKKSQNRPALSSSNAVDQVPPEAVPS